MNFPALMDKMAVLFFAIASAACMSSVVFPIPGSPPSSVTMPESSPPPVTRSSSDKPVEIRFDCMTDTSDRCCTTPPCVDSRTLTACSSIMVFQLPQAGHLPIHFGLS